MFLYLIFCVHCFPSLSTDSPPSLYPVKFRAKFLKKLDYFVLRHSFLCCFIHRLSMDSRAFFIRLRAARRGAAWVYGQTLIDKKRPAVSRSASQSPVINRVSVVRKNLSRSATLLISGPLVKTPAFAILLLYSG